MGFVAIGAGLVALYAGLEIRRIWQGDWLGIPGVTQAELYTYTVALMGLGAGLLYQAIVLRSALLRRIAMAVIAVTIAKVFLIDMSNLTGAYRAFSFIGLGLVLGFVLDLMNPVIRTRSKQAHGAASLLAVTAPPRPRRGCPGRRRATSAIARFGDLNR